MASLLGRGAAYLLQAAGPALLGKAGNFIMERGGEWLQRKFSKLERKIPVLGKVFAKWDGADKFKNTMRKHGAALIDKVGDRLMKVAPAGGSEATVKAFVDGMQDGYSRLTGTHPDLQTGGGGGQDAQMTDESVPVQRTEAPNVSMTTTAQSAGVVSDSLYS